MHLLLEPPPCTIRSRAARLTCSRKSASDWPNSNCARRSSSCNKKSSSTTMGNSNGQWQKARRRRRRLLLRIAVVLLQKDHHPQQLTEVSAMRGIRPSYHRLRARRSPALLPPRSLWRVRLVLLVSRQLRRQVELLHQLLLLFENSNNHNHNSNPHPKRLLLRLCHCSKNC